MGGLEAGEVWDGPSGVREQDQDQGCGVLLLLKTCTSLWPL